MYIEYRCARCDRRMARFEGRDVRPESLGLVCLTDQERRDIIEYDEGSDTLIVALCCDECDRTPGSDLVH